jgi:hypothetical protein
MLGGVYFDVLHFGLAEVAELMERATAKGSQDTLLGPGGVSRVDDLFGSVGFDWITYIQATLKYAELMDRATAKGDQDTLLADQVGFARPVYIML